MAEVDTSSYRLPPPPSVLDVAGKVQGLEQGRLAISQAQMNQINQGYTYLIRELNSLPADAGADQLRQYAQNAVAQRLIPASMAATFISQIPSDPSQIRAFRDTIAKRLASTAEAVNWNYGQQGSVTNQQTTQPTMNSPFIAGGAPQPVGPAIQHQLPPSSEAVVDDPNDPNFGQQRRVGPTGQLPFPVQGMQPQSPPMVPTAVPTTRVPPPVNRLPAVAPIAPVAPPAVTAPLSPGAGSGANIEDRFPAVSPTGPRGPATGLPVGVTEAIAGETAQLTADRENATRRIQGTIPLRQALTLIPQTTTGIGTETFQKIRAGLIQAGLLQPGEHDQTVVYQELNKLLRNYITRSGSADRSDAQQALAESSNPSAQTQLNPALIRIARNAAALDRIEAARSMSWESPSARGYGQHRTRFPTTVSPEAFSFDLLPANERATLFNRMKDQATNGNVNEKATAKRFFDSLELGTRLNIIQPHN